MYLLNIFKLDQNDVHFGNLLALIPWRHNFVSTSLDSLCIESYNPQLQVYIMFSKANIQNALLIES